MPKRDKRKTLRIIAAALLGFTVLWSMAFWGLGLKSGYTIPVWLPPENDPYYDAFKHASVGDFKRLIDANRARAQGYRYKGASLLQIAVMGHWVDVAEMLLQEGLFDVNERWYGLTNWKGETALIHAVRYGDKPLVVLLLKHGANPRLCASNGDSALGVAEDNEPRDIQWIIEDAINQEKLPASQPSSRPIESPAGVESAGIKP